MSGDEADGGTDSLRAAAERVIGLEEELEASGVAGVDDAAVAHAKAVLHEWVDGLTGVVVSPGLGRVTVLHGAGKSSSIASAELSFRMSARAKS